MSDHVAGLIDRRAPLLDAFLERRTLAAKEYCALHLALELEQHLRRPPCQANLDRAGELSRLLFGLAPS